MEEGRNTWELKAKILAHVLLPHYTSLIAFKPKDNIIKNIIKIILLRHQSQALIPNCGALLNTWPCGYTGFTGLGCLKEAPGLVKL